MPAPSETELKLAITAGSPSALRRLIKGSGWTRVDIDDTYFDTPAQLLRERGLALRVRRDGDRWLQTLKATQRAAGVVSERGEWEHELGRGEERPPFDPELLRPTPMRELLDAGLSLDALIPIFRARFVRRRATVTHRRSTVEIAVDQGALLARVADRVVRQPVAEVELELKAGTAVDVLHLARRLSRKAACVLVASVRSKAERGYALAAGRGLPVARASASGYTRLMKPQSSPGDALRAVVRQSLHIVAANADALRACPAIEHVHQARVALRRMRSAIRLFDPRHADLPRDLAADVRWLARVLGQARDCDVLVESTLPSIFAAAGADNDVQRSLLKSTRRLRVRAQRDAVDAVGSRRYAKLTLALASWSASTSPPGRSLADVTSELLEPLGRELVADAAAFAGLCRRDQHRVRIRAKRLRYALDLLRVYLPEERAGRYIESLADVQDALGALNDAAVAWDTLSRARLDRGGRQLVKDWHDAAEPDLVRDAARRLKSLARRTQPWPRPVSGEGSRTAARTAARPA
jgi:inorganic triphosphatase YgiF